MFAAPYNRVSTDEQAKEGFSLEAQDEINRKHIQTEGWDYFGSFTDPGFSGKNLKRPEMQALLKAIEQKRVQIVVVHKLDRLTRNIGDLNDLIKLFDKQGVKLVSVTEKLDTSTAMGRMFVFMLGIFAQWFRENLAEEVIKGMSKRADKGLRNASVAPYGYRNREGSNSLEIDSEQAEWVRLIYQWYAEKQWGFQRITKELNLRNVTGNRGGAWHQNIVQYILSNPTYIGKHHWKPKTAPEEARIIRGGDHEPIIDEVTFYKVQTIMKRRSMGDIPRSSRDAHPFSGILRCGDCGSPYHGRKMKHKYGLYFNYRCYRKNKLNNCKAPDISEVKLEKLLFDHMRVIEESIELGRHEVAAASSDKDLQRERKRIERELGKSETRRKNWQYAFGDGKLPYDDYVNLIDEEMTRVRGLQEELSQLPMDAKESPFSAQELLELMKNLRENWPYLEAPTKKSLVQNFYQKITIFHDGENWSIKQLELL